MFVLQNHSKINGSNQLQEVFKEHLLQKKCDSNYLTLTPLCNLIALNSELV